MQFSTQFFQLVLIALSVTVNGSPVADNGITVKRESEIARADGGETTAHLLSFEEMKQWITTTDAKLTFIGTPINALSTEAADSITVTYCNTRAGDVCGGTCSVYTGGSVCLDARGTECLKATGDVAFCDHSGCSGSCHQYSDCGHFIGDDFCSTPGTVSILVPPS
ncbi:hypothetical protein NM688_g3042 [Phlebia brevispora]|uniref:Uncharacterized protein n=1 Tax=Phlebia brevispora TaxID=194682 RepID=A0ACC1T6L3_9APHY|nr:hypothetical protein NM688_g3042 [Phlebia brevispora]